MSDADDLGPHEPPSTDEVAEPLPDAVAPAVDGIETAPTQELPAPPPPTAFTAPTAPVTALAPAASSVVLPTITRERRSKRILPWAVATVLGLAAATFAVLWVGKSGDADDLTKERNGLATDKAALQDGLDTTKADLETAQKALDGAQHDLESSNSDNKDLTTQVDDLQAKIDDLTQQLTDAVDNGGVFPESALALGQAFSARADPALSDEQATCLGQAILDDIGIDHLFAGVISGDTGSINALAAAAVRGARQCGISPGQLTG